MMLSKEATLYVTSLRKMADAWGMFRPSDPRLVRVCRQYAGLDPRGAEGAVAELERAGIVAFFGEGPLAVGRLQKSV
jgi:hypothetical protein